MTIRFGNVSDGSHVRVLQDIPISRTQSLPAGSTGRIAQLKFHPDSGQVELRFAADQGSVRELWLDASDGIALAAQRFRETFEVLSEMEGLPDGEQAIWPLPAEQPRISSPHEARLVKVDRLLLGDTIRLRENVTDSLGTQADAGMVARIARMESDGTGDGGVVVMTLSPRSGPELTLRFGRSWFGAKQHARLRDVFEVAPAGGFRTPDAAAPTPGTPSSPPEASAPLELHFEYLLDLAAAGQYPRAETHWQAVRAALRNAPPRDAGHHQTVAKDCGALALRLVEGNGRIGDRQLWGWFKDAALDHWYAWGAQATSGGEGSERARHIRETEKRFAQAEERDRRA